MRKIDDRLLLEMYADGQGKPQNEIAEYFNVSGAAICKRLKRLATPQMQAPESFSGLSEKEQSFVIEKVRGKTNVQAVMNSYDVTSPESAKSMGTTLMKDPDIQTAIQDLMSQVGIPKRYRVRKLKGLIDHRDGNISAKGLDMSFKLDGSYAPEKHINLNFDYEATSKKIEELRAQRARLKTEREVLEAEIAADRANGN